jgi:hypothetical protein
VDESGETPANEPMRLSFPDGQHLASQRALSNVAGAAAELTFVLAAGVALSYVFTTAVMAACGAVALAYYPLATAATGRTLSSSRLKWLTGRLGSSAPATEAEEPATLYLVPRLAATAQPLPAVPPLVVVGGEDAPARHSAAV